MVLVLVKRVLAICLLASPAASHMRAEMAVFNILD
jgi:hypothetical protein